MRCLLAALAAFSCAPATSQTITEALAYAYNTNPQLLAQRANLRATDEQVPQALSNWRPTVTFTGQAGETRAGFLTGAKDTPTSFSTFTTRSLDLSVTQPIYRGGRTEAQTRQVINTVQAARAQTLAVEPRFSRRLRKPISTWFATRLWSRSTAAMKRS
jgi:outer membrane protein